MKKIMFLFLTLFMCMGASPVMMSSPRAIGTNYAKDANCKGAWRMNVDGSETDRSTAGTETLTVSSGDTIPTSLTVPTNWWGKSRDFESGDAEYLTHADGGTTDIGAASPNALVVTVFARVKFESDTGGDQGIIVKYETSTDQRQYKLFYERAVYDSISFAISHDGTADPDTAWARGVSHFASFGDGNWHSVAGVYDHTDIRVYIDGVLDSNGANNPKTFSTGIFGGTATFMIGNGDNAQPLDGLISEAGVWNRAFSAAEILGMHNYGVFGDRGAGDY